MRKWTIEQLKLADELCFPKDFEDLVKEHFPDFWMSLQLDFMTKCNESFLAWVFLLTRDDYQKGFGKPIDAMIAALLHED